MHAPKNEQSYRGYRIALYPDYDAESPAGWGDENICGWSRHFRVENPHLDKNVFAALMNVDGFTAYAEDAAQVRRRFHVFPLDAYVHGGVVLSLHGHGRGDAWDTSHFVGCVIVAKSQARRRSTAERMACGIVEVWNQYLGGNVNGYTITKSKLCSQCGHTSQEEIERVGGIYGDTSVALEIARSAVDALSV